jgi:hypothetical protein
MKMETNSLPIYDGSDNPTGCCPRFKPEGWDEQELRFRDKLFVRVTTRSLMHVPTNMGRVFGKAFAAIEKAKARDDEQFVVLSHELSPWAAEHFFAVERDVPGEEMVRLSGDYRTMVFEGPYKDAPKWEKALKAALAERGEDPAETYFFYTTCPKCAKAYGVNYVVGVAKIAAQCARSAA